MIGEDSPIIDFYPTTFEIDMNGKRMAWQGVALLPFIDENRLLGAMQPYYAQATEEEKRRNSGGNDILFVSEHHPLFDFICALYGKRRGSEVRGELGSTSLRASDTQPFRLLLLIRNVVLSPVRCWRTQNVCLVLHSSVL